MQGFRSSISHFEQGMEKTQDDRDVREQNLPGALRGWPAVRIDRVGGVIRLHGARFAGKDAIGLLQVWLRCGLGNRSPQNTVVPSRGGNRDALSLQPAMLFIRHQVFRSMLRRFPRCADETKASQALL